jgi:hypothetical protein
LDYSSVTPHKAGMAEPTGHVFRKGCYRVIIKISQIPTEKKNWPQELNASISNFLFLRFILLNSENLAGKNLISAR